MILSLQDLIVHQPVEFENNRQMYGSIIDD